MRIGPGKDKKATRVAAAFFVIAETDGERRLPAAAAMESTIGVEAASAMEVAATVESTIAMKTAISLEATIMVETAAEAFLSVEAAAIVAVPVVAMTPVVGTPIAVIPGPCADEDAVHEPARAVVAIGGASVRIVAVVAVSADGSGTYNGSANGHSDSDLRMGAPSCGEEQNSQQNCVC